jgi:serine/threonine-protein kinase RsbW
MTRRSAVGDHGFAVQQAPATARAASDLRHQFSLWARRTVLCSNERLGDICLAVYEALANIVEHAYAGRTVPGTMDVSASYRPTTRTLTVTVTDHGSWQTPPSHHPRHRGHGLPLIRALCDVPTLTSTPDGTTAQLRWTLFARR